ncbi:MAG: hypothetical protein HYZ15_13695 [Sphingobacteriales bacterium]|nr:hypothetical protein [Sphingobacteriales bacterium]
MKQVNNRFLMALLVLASFGGYIISCSHDNEIPPPPASSAPVITRGTNIHLPGNLTPGNSNEWKMDKVHSSCLWSTAYVGAAGLLTGRFDIFGAYDITPAKFGNYPYTDLNRPSQPFPDSSWAFYENEPEKSYLNGYVLINTSNTGEPGRDGTFTYVGCNLAAMGTTQKVAYQHNINVTNVAQIKTSKIEFDKTSADYIVTIKLTWQGKLAAPITKEIIGRLKYVPKATIAAASPYDVFGLQLKFQLNCRDFGVTSTSIADKIDVECNMNFNNK